VFASSAPLEPGECRVVVGRVGDPRLDAADLLDAGERQRAAGYVFARDRDRFVARTVLLRLVLGASLRVDPARVPIERTCARCGRPHGRPRVPDADVHVSVSKSADLAVVALTRLGAVGVDVERDTATVTELADRLLAPGEDASGAGDLLALWCRKEAVVKATGDGLTVPLDEVVAQAGRPVRYRGRPLDAHVQDLEVATGYAAALAVLGPAPAAVTVIR